VSSEIHASYTSQVLPEYHGNPFIEALPEIWSLDTAIEMMSEDVEFHEGERELDANYRLQSISRLFRYFQPIEQHVDIEQRLSRCIRQGYLNRSPLKKGYAETLLSGYDAQYNPEGFQSIRSGYKPTSTGFTIIGMSGVGKSTAVERVLELYPQVIRHTSYNGRHLNLTQITWLKLDCPHDGSIKGLCFQFFDAIDSLLETNYLGRYKWRSSVINMLMIHMTQLAGLYCVGVLVIDEIQHLSLAGSGSEKMLNFFVTLVNTIGIPVVLIGTTKAKAILQGAFRQARRSSGQQGSLVWDRMKKGISWDIMVASMWKYQWTKNSIPLTQDMKDSLYDESQGIIAIAIKLYAMVQIWAIRTGAESFSQNDFKAIAQKGLNLEKPMLDALRSGNKRKIEQFDDISPFTVDDYVSTFSNDIGVIPNIPAKKTGSITDQSIVKLLELGVEPKRAKVYVGKVMATGKCGNEVGEIIKQAYQLYIIEDMQAKPATAQATDDKDLRKISEYDALKNEGYIDTVEW